MKTMSGSTHNPRPGLYVGLALVLTASLALEGDGLRLALDPGLRAAGGGMDMIVWGAVACLLGVAVTAASALRERRRAEEAARPAAVPRPRGAEEAAARAHSQKMEALGLLAGGV
ncbi:MAG TPA: hypothetical protein VHE11_12565, partial [Steroidobacteraceae bacterium]|nr:hypothetical protein [Steroidobacteraceae bacterium]